MPAGTTLIKNNFFFELTLNILKKQFRAHIMKFKKMFYFWLPEYIINKCIY